MIDVSFSIISDEKQRNELEEFYCKHKNRLYAIAFSKLHSKEDAEDAVQEVFSEISDKPEKFFSVSPEGRLAYTDIMVKNIAIEKYNYQNKISLESLEEVDPESDIILLDDSLIEKVAHDEILEFVNKLPALQRDVLMLHCIFGKTIDETAKELNISLFAAKKRLLLARKAVRKFVDERRMNDE